MPRAPRRRKPSAEPSEETRVEHGPPSRPPLGVGRLIGASFRETLAHLGRLFPIAFGWALIVAVLNRAMAGPEAIAVDPAASPLAALTPELLLAGLAQWMIGVVVSGILVLVALDALLGKRHGFGQYLAQTLRLFLPLIVLFFLYVIATAVGSLLFIVPGVYIGARYFPLVPAMLFENIAWSGLGRARDLTRGYRWPLAGLILLSLILVAAIAGSVFVLQTALPVGGGVAFALEILLSALSTVYYTMLSAVVYLRLREINDAMTRDEIAATVD